MCDPATLATLSAVGTVIGAGGSLVSSLGAMNAQKKQQAAVVDWQRQQKQARNQESLRQEELREQATAAQRAGVDQMAGAEQEKRQTTEEQRLADYLASGEDNQTGAIEQPLVSVADAALAGSQAGDATYQTDLAKKIGEASAGAKERIKALAKVSSYGDSFGGLGTVNPIMQASTGSAIDKFNEFRRGSMGAFNVEKAIDPEQISYNDGQLADVFSTAFQVGSQGLGKYGSGAFGATPSAGKTVGTDPWAGLRFKTTPQFAPTPTWRF